MKKLWIFLLCACGHFYVAGQALRTENVILITLDGFRWQELFKGADSSILFSKKFVKDKGVVDRVWAKDITARRVKLMPFLWNVVGTQGQLYGNRELSNQVNCANPYWFSYPGYSEMLVGFVDHSIHSNAKKENPNYTVLEYIQRQPAFSGKVATFSTWDVIPAIVRSPSSGVFANGGCDPVMSDSLSANEKMLNELQDLVDNPHGSRFDAFTFYHAFEYLKRRSPRMMFISFDETDEHAHGGRYDEYLKSAQHADRMLATLWNWIQSHEPYKDKTTLIITTDHGRGKGRHGGWKNHGRLSAGSSQMWIAAIGPDTPPLGEIKSETQLFQKQIAKTIASFLGLNYINTEEVGEEIGTMFYQRKMLAVTQRNAETLK